MYRGLVYVDPHVHTFIIGKCRIQGIKHSFLDSGLVMEGRVSLGHNQSIRSTKSGKWCYNKLYSTEGYFWSLFGDACVQVCR